MMQPAICVNEVCKRYQRYNPERPVTLQEAIVQRLRGMGRNEWFWALQNIAFTVEQGSVLGIIGVNGSGKSTLMSLLGGISVPDKGEVRINGRITGLLELGTGFHHDLTGRENVYVNGTIAGLTRREVTAKFDEIVSFAELEEVIEAPLRTYSTGMRMRLGFAVATHTSPNILLIDEVLAVGDSAFQQKCIQRIMQFKEEGMTIVIVSHDTHQLGQICDRILWLKAGQMMALAEPNKVIEQYLEGIYGS